MNIVYLDPSAWVKRYIAEPGSEGIDALWEAIRQERVQATCLWLGFTELVWVLQRRRNAGSLSPSAFTAVYQQFRQDCERIVWVGISWEQIQASVVWIVKHNLNSVDALHLQAALSQQALSQKEGWLSASDARLLRAARREGLQTLNPERSTPEELQRLLI